MRNIKTIIALTLVVVLLCGCGAAIKAEDLSGSWMLREQSPQDEATYLLDMIDLYTEERAFVDMDSLDYVLVAQFNEDGTYSFCYDVDANKECVREFYNGVMDALYENRGVIGEVYETDMGSMSRDEFNQFYVELYSVASYEFLIDSFVENAYDYTVLAEPIETGTYKIVGEALLCTVEGETEAGSIGVALEGDSLTLTYSDGVENYTRVK